MLIRFEWDLAKATSNLNKHGVSFETAARVFADPFALTRHDRIEGGEYRWQTVGLVEGRVILPVAHTFRHETEDHRSIEIVRIISARAADRKERRRYEQENHQA